MLPTKLSVPVGLQHIEDAYMHVCIDERIDDFVTSQESCTPFSKAVRLLARHLANAMLTAIHYVLMTGTGYVSRVSNNLGWFASHLRPRPNCDRVQMHLMVRCSGGQMWETSLAFHPKITKARGRGERCVCDSFFANEPK